MRGVLGLVWWGYVACAGAAEAQDARLTYSVERGIEGCPSEHELRAEVASTLGRDPFAHSDTTTAMALSVQRAEGELVARLEWADPNGTIAEREVSVGADCRTLLAAAQLPIVMALDALAASTAGPSTHAPAPAVVELEAVPLGESDAQAGSSDPVRPRHEPWTAHARPELGSAVGWLGTWAFLAGTVLSASKGVIRLELDGLLVRALDEQTEPGHVESDAAGAGLGGCLQWRYWDACLRVAGLRVWARAEGVARAERDARWSAFAGLGLGVRLFPNRWTGLRAELRALSPLTPLHFELSGEPAWESPAVAGALVVGVPFRVL